MKIRTFEDLSIFLKYSFLFGLFITVSTSSCQQAPGEGRGVYREDSFTT